MRKFAYGLCFTLVAIPVAVGLVEWPLSLFGMALPLSPFLFLFSSFGSLVPQLLAPPVPKPVLAVEQYVMLFLLLRRTWLFIVKKERVPLSFRGLRLGLGCVGASSYALACVLFVLSISLWAGLSVPAAMLFVPANLCVPWAFFLTEVFSFRKAGAQSTV